MPNICESILVRSLSEPDSIFLSVDKTQGSRRGNLLQAIVADTFATASALTGTPTMSAGRDTVGDCERADSLALVVSRLGLPEKTRRIGAEDCPLSEDLKNDSGEEKKVIDEEKETTRPHPIKLMSLEGATQN